MMFVWKFSVTDNVHNLQSVSPSDASVLIDFVSLFPPTWISRQIIHTHTHARMHTTVGLAPRDIIDPAQAATIMATRDNYFDY